MRILSGKTYSGVLSFIISSIQGIISKNLKRWKTVTHNQEEK